MRVPLLGTCLRLEAISLTLSVATPRAIRRRAGVPVGLLAADDKCRRFGLKTTNKTTIKPTINHLNT